MKYSKFAAMIITSTVAMFLMMYLNTYAISHVWFSETRTYMALYMGAGMAIIMLAFMLGMYSNKKLNTAIFIIAALTFALCIYPFTKYHFRYRLHESNDSSSLYSYFD